MQGWRGALFEGDLLAGVEDGDLCLRADTADELSEFIGALLDIAEGIVVYGDDELGLEEIDGASGIFDAHREVIADGKECEIDTFFSDQLHIGEEGGIACVVDHLAFEKKQKTSRIAAIGAVGHG